MPFVDSKGQLRQGVNLARYGIRRAALYRGRWMRSVPSCSAILTPTSGFLDNYDGEMKEPTLLLTTYPEHSRVREYRHYQVGMASNFCGFNLGKSAARPSELIKNPGARHYFHAARAGFLPTGG